MSTPRVPKKAAARKPSVRDAHNHCEALNDRHVGYCQEPAHHIFRHPRGLMGVLFVCQEHAHDAVGEGKRLPPFDLWREAEADDGTAPGGARLAA